MWQPEKPHIHCFRHSTSQQQHSVKLWSQIMSPNLVNHILLTPPRMKPSKSLWHAPSKRKWGNYWKDSFGKHDHIRKQDWILCQQSVSHSVNPLTYCHAVALLPNTEGEFQCTIWDQEDVVSSACWQQINICSRWHRKHCSIAALPTTTFSWESDQVKHV